MMDVRTEGFLSPRHVWVTALRIPSFLQVSSTLRSSQLEEHPKVVNGGFAFSSLSPTFNTFF